MKRPVHINRQVHLAALIAGFSLAGCLAGLHKTDPAPMPPPRDQSAERDARQIEQMEKLRAKANETGTAADASSFASVLGTLHHNKVDVRRNLPPTLVDEAATCLDRARKERPEEAHALLARKGELYIEFGRNDEGFAALRESMAARPNLRAFEILGKQHKEANEVAELERMCKKTLPGMKTDIQRYTVLDKCIQFSGASTVEGGLRWASKKDVEFYRQMRAEVDRGQAELDERHRAEDARQREKWHQEDRERERDAQGPGGLRAPVRVRALAVQEQLRQHDRLPGSLPDGRLGLQEELPALADHARAARDDGKMSWRAASQMAATAGCLILRSTEMA